MNSSKLREWGASRAEINKACEIQDWLEKVSNTLTEEDNYNLYALLYKENNTEESKYVHRDHHEGDPYICYFVFYKNRTYRGYLDTDCIALSTNLNNIIKLVKSHLESEGQACTLDIESPEIDDRLSNKKDLLENLNFSSIEELSEKSLSSILNKTPITYYYDDDYGYTLRLKRDDVYDRYYLGDMIYRSFDLKDIMSYLCKILPGMNKDVLNLPLSNLLVDEVTKLKDFNRIVLKGLKRTSYRYGITGSFDFKLVNGDKFIKVIPNLHYKYSKEASEYCNKEDEEIYTCDSFNQVLDVISHVITRKYIRLKDLEYNKYKYNRLEKNITSMFIDDVVLDEEALKAEFIRTNKVDTSDLKNKELEYKPNKAVEASKNIQGTSSTLENENAELKNKLDKATEALKALKSENDRLKAELDRLKKPEGKAPVTKDITVEELRAAFRLSLHTLYPNKFTGVRNNNGKSELFLKTAVPDDVLERYISYIKQNNGGTTNGVIDKQGRLNKGLTERLGGYLKQNKIWK